MKKFKPGDIVHVKAETWLSSVCTNILKDSIVHGVFIDYQRENTFSFRIDKSYGCVFRIVHHYSKNIIDDNAYAVELI